MQFKPIAVITVLLLVVASLFVAGCTTNPTNPTNQTTSTTPSTATHNALLEKYLAAYKKTRHLRIRIWNLPRGKSRGLTAHPHEYRKQALTWPQTQHGAMIIQWLFFQHHKTQQITLTLWIWQIIAFLARFILLVGGISERNWSCTYDLQILWVERRKSAQYLRI